jgi:hypothetical protein
MIYAHNAQSKVKPRRGTAGLLKLGRRDRGEGGSCQVNYNTGNVVAEIPYRLAGWLDCGPLFPVDGAAPFDGVLPRPDCPLRPSVEDAAPPLL